jgi:hypothetical protein
MGYLMLRVTSTKTDTQLNELLKSDAHAGVQELINLLQGLQAGTTDATVDVAVRATTQAIAADGAGLTKQYELK